MQISKCEKCGGTYEVHSHHIIYKSQAPKTMHDLPEVKIKLCKFCHSFAHSYPKIFKAWLEEKYPGRYGKLMELKKQYSKSINQFNKE